MWIGIRASAGLTLVGSLVALEQALGSLLTGSAPHPPALNAIVAVMPAVLLTALSGWGIWTSVAVFRRREWARLAMLAFAGVAALAGVGGELALLFIPEPAAGHGMDAVKWAVAWFFALLAAIGVWWLVLFSLKSSKEYFA
jgi:hypothetical protein